MTTKSRKTNTPSAKTKTKSAAAPKPAATNGGNPSRQRVEEEIADRIIELLDQGELPPWEKGWRNSQTGDPVNALTMKPYRGINRWLTLITQQSMGYDDPPLAHLPPGRGPGRPRPEGREVHLHHLLETGPLPATRGW